MFKNKIIKKQIELIRNENSLLRQSVPPENKKYLPCEVEKTEIKTVKDKTKQFFSKNIRVWGIIGLISVIGIIFAIELIILNKNAERKQELNKVEEEIVEEPLPEIDKDLYNTIGNSSANLINDGLFSRQGTQIFYSNCGDNYFLYKMNTDGSEKTKINDIPCYQINVVADRIYYLNNETRAFYSVDINGNNPERMNMLSCINMQVIDNFIYYTAFSNGSLHRMNIDGTEDRSITEELKNPLFFVYKDECYYTDTISKRLIRASDNKVLLPFYVKSFALYDEILYYIDGGQNIAYLNLQTEEHGVIDGIKAKNINVTSENIYYQSADNSWEIYFFKNDISVIKSGETINPTLLVSDYKSSLNAVSSYICYLSIDGNYYVADATNKDIKRNLVE